MMTRDMPLFKGNTSVFSESQVFQFHSTKALQSATYINIGNL